MRTPAFGILGFVLCTLAAAAQDPARAVGPAPAAELSYTLGTFSTVCGEAIMLTYVVDAQTGASRLVLLDAAGRPAVPAFNPADRTIALDTTANHAVFRAAGDQGSNLRERHSRRRTNRRDRRECRRQPH